MGWTLAGPTDSSRPCCVNSAPVAISDDDLRPSRPLRRTRARRPSTTATSRSARSWSTPTAGRCFEDRNRVKDGDATRHPEFAIARWAVDNLTPAERAAATVYTSGEHCPMCAAAHAWVGLGRIVYATSSAAADPVARRMGCIRRRPWRHCRSPPSPPESPSTGPRPEFADTMKSLYEAKFRP